MWSSRNGFLHAHVPSMYLLVYVSGHLLDLCEGGCLELLTRLPEVEVLRAVFLLQKELELVAALGVGQHLHNAEGPAPHLALCGQRRPMTRRDAISKDNGAVR